MKILKVILLILLLVIPIPYGLLLMENAFYSSAKNHLFNGDILVDEIPSDYHPENRGFWFQIPDGPSSGKRMFYRDSVHGEGVPANTIVFVHGNFTSSYTYREVIKDLGLRK